VSQVPATWHWSLAEQLTGLAPVQAPAWHVSTWVQAFPSLHAVPSVAAGFEHAPVLGLQLPTTWHSSEAVHVTGLAPAQLPAWQVSTWVQALPSLHAVPSGLDGLEHAPVEGSHAPAVWHWSLAEQVTGVVPMHVPATQASVCVQALPSLHAVPSAAAGLEHVPVEGLHVPAAWHWSEALHATGFAPAQAPAWHVSVSVQASPSLHDEPSVFAGFEHTPVLGLHVPAEWHWSIAEQVTGFAPAHVPAWHVSVCVQASPSLQEAPLATGV
jgi:hypothetical protein